MRTHQYGNVIVLSFLRLYIITVFLFFVRYLCLSLIRVILVTLHAFYLIAQYRPAIRHYCP